MKDFGGQIIEYLPKLRSYAGKLTRDRQKIDDLVQDTICRALSRQETYDENGKLLSWLLVLMHNVYINNIRKGRREQEFYHHRLSGGEEDRMYEPVLDGGQEDRVFITDMARELGQMSCDVQNIVIQHCLGETYTDIATANAIPIGTVRSRLSRTHVYLKENFK